MSPYSDMYGRAALNATISMYAYATIKPGNDGKIVLNSIDRKERYEGGPMEQLPIDGKLDLIKGVYNRVVRDYTKKPLSFEILTYADAPAGSGLGTSSTVVVTVLGAFKEWLGLPLSEYEMSHLAWEIERNDLKMAGGKQDQYAATFGGFNFMEFYHDDRVIVNPLRIKKEYLCELEFNMVLYYTGTSRLSSVIIESQRENVMQKKEKPISAMHKLKEQSLMMKEAILKGRFHEIGEILDFGWQYKKQMADGISNPVIDEIYETALKAGATGGKLSGAGGGGFMIFYCPGNARYKVIKELSKFGGEFRRYNFIENGMMSWTAK